jgi:hypothetical protein
MWTLSIVLSIHGYQSSIVTHNYPYQTYCGQKEKAVGYRLLPYALPLCGLDFLRNVARGDIGHCGAELANDD